MGRWTDLREDGDVRFFVNALSTSVLILLLCLALLTLESW